MFKYNLPFFGVPNMFFFAPPVRSSAMIANDDGSTGTRTGDGFHNSLLESLPGVFPRHLAKKNMYVFSVVKYDGFFYRIFLFSKLQKCHWAQRKSKTMMIKQRVMEVSKALDHEDWRSNKKSPQETRRFAEIGQLSEDDHLLGAWIYERDFYSPLVMTNIAMV